MAHETYRGPQGGRRLDDPTTEVPEFEDGNPLAAVRRTRTKLTADKLASLNALAEAVHDPRWESYCRNRPGTHPIPSGVTYLAQLIAHDTSLTLPRIHVFEPVKGKAVNTNLIRSPLILNTLYGRGPSGEQELYAGMRFRVGPNGAPCIFVQVREAGAHAWPTTSMPLLYDRRNGDTPMLLSMCYAFKAFHNAMIDAPAGMTSDQARALTDDQRFVYARAMTVRTWHNIVRTEVLGHVCRDPAEGTAETQALDAVANPGKIKVPANLAHAAFRCFHSLVLKNYRFKDAPLRQSIKNTLKPEATGHGFDGIDDAEMQDWKDDWFPDWPLFFDPDAEGANVTGFSPSFVFRNPKRITIAERDFVAGIQNAASTTKQLEVDRTRIDLFYQALDQALDGNGKWVDWGKKNPTPVMLGLLADGFFEHGLEPDGTPSVKLDNRLGPIASALVRHSVDTLLDNSAKIVDRALKDAGLSQPVGAEDLPQTFTAMIKTTKGVTGHE